MKHTKGKWESKKNPMLTAQLMVESENNLICQINMADFETDEEANANAKLIAAAPEMLKLIKDMCLELTGEVTTPGEAQILYYRAELLMEKIRG